MAKVPHCTYKPRPAQPVTPNELRTWMADMTRRVTALEAGITPDTSRERSNEIGSLGVELVLAESAYHRGYEAAMAR